MTNISELIAKIRDSQPREHTPLCYTPDVCQCGANVYNALRNHALALCEAALKGSQLEFCKECNHPLSDCGPQNSDGTPSMDCMVCQLKSDLLTERLAKEAAEKERDALRVEYESRVQWIIKLFGLCNNQIHTETPR